MEQGAERTRLVATSAGPVACRLLGAGPAMILLHASPGDARDFDAVAPALAAGGRTVVRVDWPGYGGSPAPRTPLGAPQFPGILAEVVDGLAVDGPLVLAGNSVGGYAALAYALDRPDRVAALVLIAPGGFTRLNPFSRTVCRLMGTPATARRLLGPLASVYTWRRTPTARAALRRAYETARDPRRRAVTCAVWRSFLDPAHDLRERAGRLRCPVLLTWGRGDPVLPLLTDGRRATRLLPGARLVRFWCGHEPYAETPEAWLAAVRGFLASAGV